MAVGRDDDATPHPESSAAASHANALPEDLCNALRARYEFKRPLGRGASAVVYLAHDLAHDAQVAIKVLHDDLTAAASSARFRREVEIERQLQHANIVPVLDSGFAAGRAYYTMPYFDGQSLREKLERERQLSIDDTVDIAGQIASALDYAHQRGVVHRDVKPANILMTSEGVRVADFGIARAMTIASGDSVTDSGFTVGTPEYMSPEQAAGNRDIDGRSDIYALGCVVYQMLAGEPPFTGPTAQAVIARHFQEAPRSVRVVRPSVTPTMQAVIERALAKIPADRFQTAGAFVEALIAARTATPASGELVAVEARGTQTDAFQSVAQQRARFRKRALTTALIAVSAIAATAYAVGNNMLSSAGTDSFRARRAFNAGTKWLAAGNFARADSAFTFAKTADSSYRQAVVWSALVRWWMDANAVPSPGTIEAATRGAAGRRALSELDTLLLAGLTALSEKKVDAACRAWSDTTTAAHRHPATFYSLGTCLRRDVVVLPDSASPSGWRYRSSYERALVAYERAFDLQPNLMGGLGAASLTELQDLFRTNGLRTREGRTEAGERVDFRAYPALDHDTLSYVPFPRAQLLASPVPRSFALAVQHQRKRLLRIARSWSASAPQDPYAAKLEAVSLDLLGDAAAPEAFRRALVLADNSADSLSIAAEEVLVRVKHALPNDTAALRSATRVIDSLLDAHKPAERVESRMLGSLAALAGKAGLAAEYAANGGVDGMVHALTGSAPSLLTYASLGGPVDSLAKFEELMESAIGSLPVTENDRARKQWLWRAAALAHPEYSMKALRTSADVRRSSIEPTVAALGGDSQAVTEILATLGEARTFMRPTDVMIESLFAEAAASVSTNNAAAAVNRIDPWLQSIRFAATSEMGQIPRTGALVRAMCLRAELAAKAGDDVNARRWANAVILLWSNADEFLQTKVEAMKALAR